MSEIEYKDSLTVSEAVPDYHPDKRYTFEDWLSWDERFRAELHDGRLVVMEIPTKKHQGILGEIFGQLWLFLKGKPCKVFLSPYSVRLNENEDTLLEPDIIVVCDEKKIEGIRICLGAPDMVVEILSPSTSRYDRVYKFEKYQKAGVREYWIVDPNNNTVQVNILQGGYYVTRIFDKTKTVPLTALDGCQIVLPDVFEGW